MKIAIFGATGGIGRFAVQHALKKGYDVTAFVRNPAKFNMKNEHLSVAQGDFTDETAVRNAISGCDAVICCVGIPMQRNYEGMASLEGHRNLLKAMQDEGVNRLIDWATPSVHFEKDKKSFITIVPGMIAEIAFAKAKKEIIDVADAIRNSNIDWTIVRFLAPKDTACSGKVKVGFGDRKMSFNISREDIAAFMVEQVEDLKYIRSMPIIGS